MTLHKCMPRGVIVKNYLLSLILMLPISIFVVAQDNEAEDEVEEEIEYYEEDEEGGSNGETTRKLQEVKNKRTE